MSIFIAQTQTFQTTTFSNGTWNNGDPVLAIGQSAFFNLAAVSEPSVCALGGLGLLMIPVVRNLRRKK